MPQWNKSLHKWLSLLVGIQLLIWLVTGLYFNLMDHKKASGNSNLQRINHQGIIAPERLIPVTQLAVQDAKHIGLLWLFGKPYYQVTIERGAHNYQPHSIKLFDASTGAPFTLNESLARTIALKSYNGPVNIISADLLAPPMDELPKQKNPLWQVKLQDELHTHVYIEPTSGAVVAHINDERRLRDLMFKLHFMDYLGTGDFNHWLIITFALLTLALTITGLTWLIERYRVGQLSFAQQHKTQRVTVHESNTQQTHVLTLDKHSTLFDSLAQQGIALPSNCGGGGTCGMCRIQTNQTVKVTQADQTRLSQSKLEQGFRLACQHNACDIQHITVRTLKGTNKNAS
ncbi:2Fe-2S iron-sulfur cluster-binding protein [Pseudoalteromonas sp. MMG022]|uniref:2Fe-2S iron-sulfur cluster-binding protein n=1 Tax=Pseudoalteromonas sp. MMG022 TaxID=2909978 RepID=UPI001F022A14|nr:2Fe-2S iron-sulfur cluster-binding protein [Pseudoalteromonas sp. MMG022]MCF6437198.1 2Fe-2S iron-sulfur cluster-binding protein [Pseudoalteromonas sp. MMG022]